jgi:hypothetical protein
VTRSVPICALLAIGCGHWEWRRGDLMPESFNDADTVIVWSHRTPLTLAHVLVTRDSISGIPVPFLPMHPEQRESLPLADVDSIKHYQSTQASTVIGGIVLGTVLLGIFFWALWAGPH